jgi:hypothetical protein
MVAENIKTNTSMKFLFNIKSKKGSYLSPIMKAAASGIKDINFVIVTIVLVFRSFKIPFLAIFVYGISINKFEFGNWESLVS